jgi:RIO kinase 1
MHDPLAPLLHDGVIDEVVARLKSGKEADLWLVRCRGEVVAAKVYKAREARSFRNNAAYKEGRQVRDTRTQRALARGSRFGQKAAEDAWKTKEADALHALHAAGVRVPRPVLFYEGVLLMEVVVDEHGHPAPRLVDAHVAPETAAAMYADLRGQVVRMLGCDLVHGDLSPYNVLVGREGPVVIDFPQVVGAAHNRQAEAFFQRDLENLRRFFAALDPALRAAAGDAREIWRAYERRELTADFVPSGRAEEPPRRQGRPQGGERRPHGAGEPRAHGAAERAPHGGERRAQGGGGPHGAGERRRHAGEQRAHGARPPQARPGPRGAERPRRGPPAPEVVRMATLPRAPSAAPAQPHAAPHHAAPPRPHHAGPSHAGPTRPQHAGPSHAGPTRLQQPAPQRPHQAAPRPHHPARPHGPPPGEAARPPANDASAGPRPHAATPDAAGHPPARRRRRRRRPGGGGGGGTPAA